MIVYLAGLMGRHDLLLEGIRMKIYPAGENYKTHIINHLTTITGGG